MSSYSIPSSAAIATDVLLVRDVDGQYRPALAEEALRQARRVLAHRVRRGATMSSPQAVKDHLRLEIGVLAHNHLSGTVEPSRASGGAGAACGLRRLDP